MLGLLPLFLVPACSATYLAAPDTSLQVACLSDTHSAACLSQTHAPPSNTAAWWPCSCTGSSTLCAQHGSVLARQAAGKPESDRLRGGVEGLLGTCRQQRRAVQGRLGPSGGQRCRLGRPGWPGPMLCWP